MAAGCGHATTNRQNTALKLKFRRPEVDHEVAIQAGGDGHMVELLMRDNGIGFDAKHGERIFGVLELPINTSADGYGLRTA